MSVFEARDYYKPFKYPWAFEAYDMQQKMHWLPSEVPLHEDVNDWNTRMDTAEKNLVKQDGGSKHKLSPKDENWKKKYLLQKI